MLTMTKRRIVGAFVGLLLALEIALVIAQSGAAVPWGLGNKLLGPNMLRAEIVVKTGGVYHDYLLDNGRIRNLNPGASTITLVEKDGKVVTVAVAPGARITLNGSVVPLSALRRNLRVMTVRDGNAPAETVQASK
jgi:hypothetical protein